MWLTWSHGFYPDLGVFHVKSVVLLFLRFWLQLVATTVETEQLQLVEPAVGAVVISCNQLRLAATGLM
jgi:hypothetical protein